MMPSISTRTSHGGASFGARSVGSPHSRGNRTQRSVTGSAQDDLEPDEDLRVPEVPVCHDTSVCGEGLADPQPLDATTYHRRIPNDPALVPVDYVREACAVCVMRLADVNVCEPLPAEELRAILHLFSTQPLGDGFRCWALALWGLAHDATNRRRLVRLGAFPVLLSRMDQLREVVVGTVKGLANVGSEEEDMKADMRLNVGGYA